MQKKREISLYLVEAWVPLYKLEDHKILNIYRYSSQHAFIIYIGILSSGSDYCTDITEDLLEFSPC